MEPSPSDIQKPKEPQSFGPIAGAIIIVLVFIIGGVYFLVKQEQRVRAEKLQEQQTQLPVNS